MRLALASNPPLNHLIIYILSLSGYLLRRVYYKTTTDIIPFHYIHCYFINTILGSTGTRHYLTVRLKSTWKHLYYICTRLTAYILSP